MVVSPLEDRYRTEMNAVFDEENRLRRWMDVEIALAKAHAALGNIPSDAPAKIEAAAKKVRLARVKQIENEIHHDLMAMVKALAEQCPKSYGGYVHIGATSYDIEDTATALIFQDALTLTDARLIELMHITRRLAAANKERVCIGRTHGQHAVPTTYGLKFAIYYRELRRHKHRLEQLMPRILVGKMSGAVGTMATFGKDAFYVEWFVMSELGLRPAAVTNQVLQRDRHAEAMFLLALIASTLEKIAKEVRNLQRTEIMELAEPFAQKQVGSSTMPQKRNPHKSERICSLARIVRGNVATALENIPLEHERDLTNSASERFIFAESFITTDYMMKETAKVLNGLEFFPDNIECNLEFTNGRIMAERVMIALTKKGIGRQDAHELVREASIISFKAGKPLEKVLAEDRKVTRLLKPAELKVLFDPHTYIGEAKKIVERSIEE